LFIYILSSEIKSGKIGIILTGLIPPHFNAGQLWNKHETITFK